MEIDSPHYRAYGYYADSFMFEFTHPVDAACDAEMIDDLREQITPDPGDMPDSFCHADLFFCHGDDVKLIGTWVITPDEDRLPNATWHPGGWADRPRPSRETALRFLQQLGRPA